MNADFYLSNTSKSFRRQFKNATDLTNYSHTELNRNTVSTV